MGFPIAVLLLLLAPLSALAVSESHGQLGLENTTYYGRLEENPETGSFSTVELDYRGRARSRTWGEAQLNASGLAFLDNFETIANVREGFLASTEVNQWTGARLSLGRKLENWSETDRLWTLGVWEPRFRWDYLHPERQGLTGLFLELYEPDSYHFVAFATPYFLPDQGPSVQTEQGRIISRSPWVNRPVSQVEFGGVPTPVIYTISRPSVGEVVQNPGGALMLELGSRKHGAWFRGASAYKPINQFALAANRELAPRETGPNHQPVSQFNVDISPHVIYHYVYEATLGFEGQKLGASMSVLKDRPVVRSYPDTVLAQQFTPAFIVTPALAWKFQGDELRRVELSWLRRWGGDGPDMGQFANPNSSLFEPRFDFENAISLSVETPLFLWKLGTVHYQGKMIYEASGQGMMLSNSVRFNARQTWAMVVGADLLGQINGGEDPESRSLLTRYRQNDRIHGGVSFVF